MLKQTLIIYLAFGLVWAVKRSISLIRDLPRSNRRSLPHYVALIAALTLMLILCLIAWPLDLFMVQSHHDDDKGD